MDSMEIRATGVRTAANKLRTLTGLLRSWGYDDQDFVIEADQTEALASLFALSGGVVKVSRRSTGECRLYATGIESAWISSLLLDLARGHLADAPETVPVSLHSLTSDRSKSH